MEKQTIEVEKKSFGKRGIILTSWASVATALFLVAIIGGAIYITDIRSQCDLDESNTDETSTPRTAHYKLTEDDEEEEEDVYMDDKLKTQLFIKRNKEGAITLIADVDYNRKISATYMAGINQCLLSAGEDMDWYSDWNPPKDKDTAPERTEENTHYFKADPDNKVTDMSLLPKNIRPFCEGKEIYWTIPATAEDIKEAGGGDTDSRRKKRGWSCGWYCYWSWYGGYRCGFRCRYTWGK